MKSVPLISGGLSLFLSACSGGGGSFDVDDVSNPSSSKPRYQDDTSNQRKKSNLEKLSIPSLGGGMKLVAQNLRGREPSLLNEDGYIIFSSLSKIEDDFKKENQSQEPTIGSIDEPSETNSPQNHHGQQYVYSGLYYIQSWRNFSNGKFYSGYYGYAYYFGKQTATTLPVNGEATYKGTWSFITATERGKNYSLFSNSSGQGYSRRSAISEDIDLENDQNNGETGLISQFSADFGTKKLKGELFYTKRKTNNQNYEKKKLYDIDANIYSNRFRGKVKPTEKDSEEHPFTREGTLEGGFYGPNGEELGGKFLAGDKKVFGVFSAKETEETKQKTLPKETLIDGKLTTFSTKKPDATTSTTANAKTDATTNAENFTTKDISSFGEADYLLIDNYPVPLLPETENSGDFATSKHYEVRDKTYKVEACCKNLSYVKFGMYYEDNKKNNKNETEQYHQFLLGLRTASSKIPTTGNVKYRGSWFGYISDGETSY